MLPSKLVVLQIISIGSIPQAELESFCLDQIDPDYMSTCSDLWTPKPHVQYEPANLEGATIEAIDHKTMAVWSGGGDTIFRSDTKTAIKVNGDWYIVIDQFGDYDWI